MVLETYTGVLAYDEERDEHRIVSFAPNVGYDTFFPPQIDFYDEERRDEVKFEEIADANAGKYTPGEIHTVFLVTQSCLQSSYKKRLPIDQVFRETEILEH